MTGAESSATMLAAPMKIASMLAAMVFGSLAAGSPAMGQVSTSTSDDRIVVSADGTTLTGTNGGAGASLGWLHNFDASNLAGIAVEHQGLSDAQWTFASLNGSTAVGPADQRYTFSAEAHEGAGRDGLRAFHYRIEAVDVAGTYDSKLTALIEDRRIDVETTHGNLPKAGLTYLWSPHVSTSVAYQYSVSGNLGTRLPSGRIDTYWATINLFGGGAWGPTSPVLFDVPTGFISKARQFREGYVGASKPFPKLRSTLTIVADYEDLSGSKKTSLTLSYIFHVGG
ncbi:MAG TPA: hypothetical protein VGL87_06075 [Steroidobacteraceae bacterium]|jgi:hypothetical protein